MAPVLNRLRLMNSWLNGRDRGWPSPTPSAACDEIALSAEFVPVGFLGLVYAGIHVVIDSRGYGDGVLAS